MNKSKEKFLLFENHIGSEFKYGAALGLLLAYIIYFVYRLPVSFTQIETEIFSAVQSNALNFSLVTVPATVFQWPYYLIQVNVAELLSINAVRLTAIIFCGVGIVSFYSLLRLWFGNRDALLGTVLLTVNTGFLLSSVLISGAAGYSLAVISLGLIGLTLLNRDNQEGLYFALPSLPLALYIGLYGWIYTSVASAALYLVFKRFSFQLERKHRILAAACVLLCSLPFAVFLIRGYTQIWPWSINSISGIFQNLNNGLQVIIFGAENSFGLPIQWSLISLAEVSLLILGLLLCKRKFSATRYRLILALLTASIAVLAVYGASAQFVLAFLIPSTILALSALRYLRDSWHIILPRNKAGKSFASLMVILIFISVVSLHIMRSTIYLHKIESARAQFNQTIYLNQ